MWVPHIILFSVLLAGGEVAGAKFIGGTLEQRWPRNVCRLQRRPGCSRAEEA